MSNTNPFKAGVKRSCQFKNNHESMPKKKKLDMIINREYGLEIELKEAQAERIDDRIRKTKLLLQQLRYIIVEYYRKQSNPNPTDEQIGSPHRNFYRKRLQQPCSKDTSNSQGKHNVKESTTTTQNSETTVNPLDSNYKPRIVASLNSPRSLNQTKHLINIGNTSKYIGMEKPSDSTTHKWLIYVQCKSETPIENLISKARFFLHPSYSPNDVVDIQVPPFQIARRGWGEFPVRIQLFFKEHFQQKPLQLTHNLVLDKTLSGLQTMGAETLVEIWLKSLKSHEDKPLIDYFVSSNSSGKSLNNLNKINSTVTHKSMSSLLRPTEIIRNPPVAQQENSAINQPNGNNSNMFGQKKVGNLQKSYGVKSPSKLEKMTTEGINHKKVFQKGGKMFVIDPLQKILKKQSLIKPQVSLLRTQAPISLLKPTQVSSDHDYSRVKVTKEAVGSSIQNQSFSDKLESKFMNIKFSTIRHAIDFLLRKLPLVSPMADDHNFRSDYPFIVSTLEEYQKLGSIKQFAHEWLRAKYVRKCLSRHSNMKKLDLWRTKEIIIYSREHGFLPAKQNMNIESEGKSMENLSRCGHKDFSFSDEHLSMMIKNEMNVNPLDVQTLSLCHKVYEWINCNDIKVEKTSGKSYNQIIDVDNTNSNPGASSKLDSDEIDTVKEKLCMDVLKNFEPEFLFVGSLTKDTRISPHNEFVKKDVLYPSSQMILSQVLRLFLGDLLRRSIKNVTDYQSVAEIKSVHILKAIKSTIMFDFLSNKNLGTVETKKQ